MKRESMFGLPGTRKGKGKPVASREPENATLAYSDATASPAAGSILVSRVPCRAAKATLTCEG